MDHLAEDNPSAPFDMWDEIERQVQRLRDFPHSGRAGRIPKTRELVVTGTPFVVIYMVGENVEVIRVLHGAQKWPAAE
ncbi:type II toxin-antitoxin system RelE/ParE family toxin [Sinorhizobium meliloti]|uniref:type II toxin-antitoxin system RelE/ParE family toxin n=1 Tax=Rhizobium meliloti TaxID=382 RepID=UPI0035ABD2D0